MSFVKHNLDVNARDAPEFPDTLPSGTHINVPFPVNNYPTWTTYPYDGYIPPTFDNLIITHLPNARLEPAFYAATTDTIRMTNTYFELVGRYDATKYPLTEKLVRQEEQNWRSERGMRDGRLIPLYPANSFPRPPDPRTLFVKEAMGDPSDSNLNALWNRACRDWHIMSDETKERYLGYTRDELIERGKFKTDQSWLVLEMFKRYLVWREFIMEMPEDVQPTRAEMEAFFDGEGVKQHGATLADICHAFPYARDIQMLVYRIERSATLTPQPSVKTRSGIDDPVESRYIRNAVPSEEKIRALVSHHLGKRGSSISFPELLARFWPNTGNQQFIADVLVTIARPDLTTARFILMAHEIPDASEIGNTLTNRDLMNGFTFTEFVQRFPNRVWSTEQFEQNMLVFAHLDRHESRYFPLHVNEDDFSFLDAEESIAARDQARIESTWRPETVLEDYTWDRGTQRYVRRPERLQLSVITGVETTPIEPQSPTEVATSVGSSPPPLKHFILHSGVVAAMETTPVDIPATLVGSPAPAVVPAAPARSPPPAEPTEPAEPASGRSRKRPPPEPLAPSKASKKPRPAPKIRCSQNTQKGTRCKRMKDRADDGEEWDCGVHNRG